MPRKTESRRRPTTEARTADRPVNEPATRVLRRFRVVFNAVKTYFRQVEKTAGVGGAQLWALSVIRDAPGMGVNELAKAMDAHQSTASNHVKSLVEQGMVAVARNSTDRRTVQLRTLPAGARALRRAPEPFTGVLPDALNNLDVKTLARLEKDLGKLIYARDVDERDAGIPLGQS